MKLTIDTDAKTIEIHEATAISELTDIVDKLKLGDYKITSVKKTEYTDAREFGNDSLNKLLKGIKEDDKIHWPLTPYYGPSYWPSTQFSPIRNTDITC